MRLVAGPSWDYKQKIQNKTRRLHFSARSRECGNSRMWQFKDVAFQGCGNPRMWQSKEVYKEIMASPEVTLQHQLGILSHKFRRCVYCLGQVKDLGFTVLA